MWVVLRSWRTWGCLALGAALWLELGAVRGATQWQVTATGYVVGVLVASLALGLVAPGPRYTTGVLLVLPGAAALVTADRTDHPDLVWWCITVLLAGFTAALVQRLATDLRRFLPLLRHPKELRFPRRRRRDGLPLSGTGR
jgi:hypothetical protein